jgi:hypothetical protein
MFPTLSRSSLNKGFKPSLKEWLVAFSLSGVFLVDVGED